MKRIIYFLTERLQISKSERIAVYSISIGVLFLTALHPVVSDSPEFDESFYEAVIAEFNERAGISSQEEQKLLARYFPEEQPGTKPTDEPLAEHDVADNSADDESESEVHDADHQKTETDETERISGDRININEADVDELVKLPGIGPAIAARIVEYREEHGPFEELEDLKNVRGIGEARFDNIRDLIKL